MRQSEDNILSVYVVADFEPMRLGLVEMISATEDMRVTGAAPSVNEMAGDDSFRNADVLIIDADALNQASGGVIQGQLNEWLPALRVLVVGSAEDARAIRPEDLPVYMQLASVGFVFKRGAAHRVLAAVRLVASGIFVCEMEAIKSILLRLSQWTTYSPDESGGQLSEREVEVLKLVATGRSNRDIAQQLFLAEGTIKAHVNHIMVKVGVERRAELIRYALGNGISLE